MPGQSMENLPPTIRSIRYFKRVIHLSYYLLYSSNQKQSNLLFMYSVFLSRF